MRALLKVRHSTGGRDSMSGRTGRPRAPRWLHTTLSAGGIGTEPPRILTGNGASRSQRCEPSNLERGAPEAHSPSRGVPSGRREFPAEIVFSGSLGSDTGRKARPATLRASRDAGAQAMRALSGGNPPVSSGREAALRVGSVTAQRARVGRPHLPLVGGKEADRTEPFVPPRGCPREPCAPKFRSGFRKDSRPSGESEPVAVYLLRPSARLDTASHGVDSGNPRRRRRSTN